MRKSRGGDGAFDMSALAGALARPHMDTRQWISYGIVQPDTGDAKSVRFDDDDGDPLPTGMLVDVKLEPSGLLAQCRVLGQGGVGEAEGPSLGPGDEVLVAVPEGDERAGCVILGSLNNAKDARPQLVAGMDTTQNNLSFKRVRNSWVVESAGALMLAQAATHASLSIRATGEVMAASGDGHIMSLSSDALVLQTVGGNGLQVQPEDSSGSNSLAALTAGDTQLTLSDAGSGITTPGTLSLSASGQAASGHGVTVEQVVQIVTNLLVIMAGTPYLAFGPSSALTNDSVAATKLTEIWPLVFAGMALPKPVTDNTGGGQINPVVNTALAGGIAATGLVGSIDFTGLYTCLGRGGLLL